MTDKVKKNKGGRPRVEHPKMHKCDHCDYTSRLTTAIKAHYLAAHASEEERVEKYNFYCHFCKVGFMSPKTMETHKNTKGHKRRAG